MGSDESVDRVFQQRGVDCPSSVMVGTDSDKVSSGVTMCPETMFKTPNGMDSFFGNNWDPIVSLSQSGNFGNSAMVCQNEFANPHCSVMLESQTMGSSSHLVHFPSDSGLVDMVPRIPGFGGGSFSEMVSSFGPNSESGCHLNLAQKTGVGMQRPLTKIGDSHDHCQNSGDGVLGSSPYGKRKREVPQGASSKNAEEEQQKDPSGDTSEFPRDDNDERKQKLEKNICQNPRGKQASKQAKDNSTGAEPSKENYIHVRAKRGQATNSHSLAERVRRERISERMRLLQELVPGCNKITGKAMMLDEIINYVQSLQQQVEFLSMKLATVNPELNVDIDRILSKDILLRGSNPAALGIAPGLGSSHPFAGYPQGTISAAGTNAPFHSLPQHMWNNELQGILQMGFDPDPDPSASMGLNALSKMEK